MEATSRRNSSVIGEVALWSLLAVARLFLADELRVDLVDLDDADGAPETGVVTGVASEAMSSMVYWNWVA